MIIDEYFPEDQEHKTNNIITVMCGLYIVFVLLDCLILKYHYINFEKFFDAFMRNKSAMLGFITQKIIILLSLVLLVQGKKYGWIIATIIFTLKIPAYIENISIIIGNYNDILQPGLKLFLRTITVLVLSVLFFLLFKKQVVEKYKIKYLHKLISVLGGMAYGSIFLVIKYLYK